jgi:hypothetical protein
MAINFPGSPTLNQIFTSGSRSWKWDGSKWVSQYGANAKDLSNLDSNLVPSANVTYDLGTADNAWRDLYLSGSSINLGGATISETGGSVILPAGSKVGDITLGASGATQYANATSLPTSGLTAGQFAFVGNTLFMTNGSGWYSVALINQTPELTLSTSSITLGAIGNTINFTFTATDPDGPTPTVTATTTANTSQANVTVYTANSTVTVENLSADPYSANITITASDGINQTFDVVELRVQYFAPPLATLEGTSAIRGTNTGGVLYNYGVDTDSSGTTLYMARSTTTAAGGGFRKYTVSTPFNLSTKGSPTLTTSHEFMAGIYVPFDGKGMDDHFICINQSTGVLQKVDRATLTPFAGDSRPPSMGSVERDICYSPDGEYFFAYGSNAQYIARWDCSVPFTHNGSEMSNFVQYNMDSLFGFYNCQGFYWQGDGLRFWVFGFSPSQALYQIECTTPWDLSTGTVTHTQTNLDRMSNINLSKNGAWLYHTDESDGQLYQKPMTVIDAGSV